MEVETHHYMLVSRPSAGALDKDIRNVVATDHNTAVSSAGVLPRVIFYRQLLYCCVFLHGGLKRKKKKNSRNPAKQLTGNAFAYI